MSYESQAALELDAQFRGRCGACITQQSQVFVNDTRGDIKALANEWLRSGAPNTMTPQPLLAIWMPIISAEPGFADSVDNGLGNIEQGAITDQQLLSSVQGQYPAVAALLYDQEGNPVS